MKTKQTTPTKPILIMTTDDIAVYWFGLPGTTAITTIQVDDDGLLYYSVGKMKNYLPREWQTVKSY